MSREQSSVIVDSQRNKPKSVSHTEHPGLRPVPFSPTNYGKILSPQIDIELNSEYRGQQAAQMQHKGDDGSGTVSDLN